MKAPRNFAAGFRPPAFLGQPDSMFAGDDSAPCQHLGEQFIEHSSHFLAYGSFAIVAIRHEVDVNIPVSGVTETGDRKS